MKKFIIILIAALPLANYAGTGDKDKTKKINISVHTGKDGKVEISGLTGKDLKELEKNINNALKDVNINIGDGKEKHQLHFKAELKID